MKERNGVALLNAKLEEGKNVCVGLDSTVNPKREQRISDAIQEFLRKERKLPPCGSDGPLVREFNKAIIAATCDLVCAYKYNYWFYANQMYQGLHALESSIAFVKEIAPDILQILDYKGGDVGESAKECAEFAFEKLGVDAVTVNPWVGYEDGLDAFFEYEDKMIFVWCRGSNKGAQDFQDASIMGWLSNQERARINVYCFYQEVAERAAQVWSNHGNCGLVVGAADPWVLKEVREIAGDTPILVPGIGAQGGDLEAAVRVAGPRTLFNSSRGIIYASAGPDFAEVARREVAALQLRISEVMEAMKNGCQ